MSTIVKWPWLRSYLDDSGMTFDLESNWFSLYMRYINSGPDGDRSRTIHTELDISVGRVFINWKGEVGILPKDF